MTAERKKQILRAAAPSLALLLCCGLYFGAQAAAERRFSAAVEAASDPELQQLDGLWNYNALTAREQQLYEVLRDAMERRDTETARLSFVPTQNEFTAAYDAVLYDHPLFCDLVRELCTLTVSDYSAAVTLGYLEDGQTRREVLCDTVSSMLEEVGSASDTPMDAALLLHDMLTARCTWISEEETELTTDGETAYDALCSQVSGGLGYALAYSMLCRASGVDCAVVTGTASDGERQGMHAWNALNLDGTVGYTDVMWNDAAAVIAADGAEQEALPFHGYYFLSDAEMRRDHVPAQGAGFGQGGETNNYYEQMNCCITDAQSLEPMLTALVTDARRTASGAVEFWLDPALGITGYALEEALGAAIVAANADSTAATAELRSVNRIYRTAFGGGGITVQLFYEENDELLGET